MAYAKTADELRDMIHRHPDASPSVFLSDDSLAAHCYDRMSVRELKSAFNGDADRNECLRWGLNHAEWREQVFMALIARQAIQSKAGSR